MKSWIQVPPRMRNAWTAASGRPSSPTQKKIAPSFDRPTGLVNRMTGSGWRR